MAHLLHLLSETDRLEGMMSISLRTGLLVGCVALLFGGTAHAAITAPATTIVYEFSSASYNYFDVATDSTDTDGLSGTFAYDTVLGEITGVDFTVSGPNASPNPDSFTNIATAAKYTNDAFGFEGANDSHTAGFSINFANNLSDDADDLITVSNTSDNYASTQGGCSTNCTGYIDLATSVSGSADPVFSETANTTLLAGGDTQYAYSFTNLTGSGDVFIPILDPSGIVSSSLPGDATLITNQTTIADDWPGSDNTIPSGKSIFDNPALLLEIPDSGASSFSFLDSDPAVNGPILAYGTLLDPPVPGPAPVPEPGTLWLVASALIGFGLIRRRRRREVA